MQVCYRHLSRKNNYPILKNKRVNKYNPSNMLKPEKWQEWCYTVNTIYVFLQYLEQIIPSGEVYVMLDNIKTRMFKLHMNFPNDR